MLDLTLQYPQTSGLLFIGDPHLWTKKPGRRRDDSFLDTILGKLEHAAEIANRLNLLPIFLGDLFEDENDYEPSFLVRVVLVLNKFNRKPITLTGNHEKKEHQLTDRDALYLLQVTNQITVIDTSCILGTLQLVLGEQTHKILLGGTPFGQTPPSSLTELYDSSTRKKNKTAQEYHSSIKTEINVDDCIWLTHDDYAFEGAYPGAKPLEPIFGVDMLINGHMHATKKPFRTETTIYYNPGNITRMSVDLSEHKPSVWSWSPFKTKTTHTSQGVSVPALEQHILPHAPGQTIFSHEGRHHLKSATIRTDLSEEKSEFVSLLLQDDDIKKTDDGTFIQESLDRYYAQNVVPDGIRSILSNLLQRSIQKTY